MANNDWIHHQALRGLPAWLRCYDKQNLQSDVVAGLLMGLLVIPQSLGYASLAGLPPIAGLYASIVPTLVYAYLGASPIQAVGPVAVTAIMTAAALSPFKDTADYISLSLLLALMVGVVLTAASFLKLGFIMQFISRGVSAGFISAAAILIILSQLKNLIGAPIEGGSFVDILSNFYRTTSSHFFHAPTALVGISTLIILLINRQFGSWLYQSLPTKWQTLAPRLFILMVAVLSIWLVRQLHLGEHIRTVTALPQSLSRLTVPSFEWAIMVQLLPSALLIAFIAFVSTAAISHRHATAHHYPYDANKELFGLGCANIASSLFGGFVVAGGISRTSLNLSLGARTPLAGIFCALTILLILLFLSDFLTGLPYAVLAAIIITSVITMIDIKTLRACMDFGAADFVPYLTAFFGVLIFGLNAGLLAALLVSFGFVIYQSHKVHIAVVGQVGDSEHFRNIERHSVRTFENLLLIRIDESLYFVNSDVVKARIDAHIANHPSARHIVLIMAAVNHIDMSASQMLIVLNQELMSANKCLHYSEIKGPVMDLIAPTPVITDLSGQVFLSTIHATNHLKSP